MQEHRRRPARHVRTDRPMPMPAVVFILGLVLASGCSELSTGDLDAVKDRGVLRIAVPPGFVETPPAAIDQGDVRTDLRHLAARLGVEISWVEAERHDLLLALLGEGRADMVVSRLSPASLIGRDAVATAPVEWVDELLVTGTAMPELRPDDLRGGVVTLQTLTPSPAVTKALDELGLEIETAFEDVAVEDLLSHVVRGTVASTVVDSGILAKFPEAARLQVIGPLVERRPVAWVVREGNLQLRRAIDDFLV